MQTIVFTANDRPWYLNMTLDSWSRARGIENARVEFYIEPGNPATVKEASKFSPVPHEFAVRENSTRLGVQRNPFRAMCSGFERADFVILAEDDIVVSTDVLEYFAWAEGEFRNDMNVLAVSARQHTEQPGGLGGVRLGDMGPVPMMWVWGTWKDRWETLIGPDWTFNYEHGGWDWRLHNHFVRDRGFRIASPSFSRCQHIGQHGGTHMLPAQHADLESRCYQVRVPRQLYRVTEA